ASVPSLPTSRGTSEEEPLPPAPSPKRGGGERRSSSPPRFGEGPGEGSRASPARLYPLTFRRIFGNRRSISSAHSSTTRAAVRYASPSSVRNSSFRRYAVGDSGPNSAVVPSASTA